MSSHDLQFAIRSVTYLRNNGVSSADIAETLCAEFGCSSSEAIALAERR